MDKIRILIADDIEIQRNILKSMVENVNYVEIIGVAENGQEEYDLIKKLNPQLVLTDNQMPILNGVDVIKKIREDGNNETDFIIITGDRGLFAEISQYNVCGILNKPYDKDNVVRLLEEYKYEKENLKSEIKEITKKKKGFLVKSFKI